MALGPASPAVAAPPQGDPEAARKLFREAEDARLAKDYATCVTKTEQAFAAYPQVQILGQLGSCEYELGRYVEAAKHLTAYVADSNNKLDPGMQEAFDKSKARVAEVEVTCNAPGAAVTIDGADVGVAPTTVFLLPGRREFAAKKEGYLPRAETRDLLAGVKIKITIELAAEPGAGGGGAGGSYGQGGGDSRPAWPGAVGLGVTGAGLILGGVFTGLSFSRASDYESGRHALGSSCSESAPSSVCQEAFDARDDQVLFANAAVTTFIISGAIAATSIGLLIWAANGDEDDVAHERVHVAPVIGPDAQGLFLQTTF